ncbi:MAG TPA: DUF1223 domain-containing protein [Pseudolabrys sp.]|nr:DUF1223 domain-containing protein [Pseudolabrys sp.]
MNYRHIAFAAVFFSASAVTLSSASAGEPRAVLELFTSQGCSSCPAADRLMGKLAADPTLVTLSLPVDYWDYLGWKDTLALHGHSQRQHAYAEARGDRAVYTPQVVVNGIAHVLGSDKSAIEAVIAKTDKTAAPLTLPVKVAVADGKITVNVPDAKGASQRGEVWLCPVSGKVIVTIQRGENRGRTLTYTNVVRRWVKLGDWTGKAESFSVPVASLAGEHFSLEDIDHVAVLVQSGEADKPGLMLGAATAELR